MNEVGICDLNDDCLLEIFKNLSIPELIGLETICDRFKEIAHRRYRSYRVHAVSLRDINLSDYDKVLSVIGTHLRTLSFSNGYAIDGQITGRIIATIANSCPNLEQLTLNYFHFKSGMLDDLAKVLPSVVKLNLDRCILCETDGEWLRSARKLREISVCYTDFALDAVWMLRDLEMVNFGGNSEDFATTKIDVFVRHNPNLRCLNLQRCHPNWLNAFSEHLTNLVELIVSESKDYAWLSSLKKLQYFTALNNSTNDQLLSVLNAAGIRLAGLNLAYGRLTKGGMIAIGQMCSLRILNMNHCRIVLMPHEKHFLHFQQLTQLQELYLRYANVTQENLRWIIRHLKELRILDVQECTEVNDTWMNSIEIDMEQDVNGDFNRDHIVRIYVYGTPLFFKSDNNRTETKLSHRKFELMYNHKPFSTENFMCDNLCSTVR